MKIFIASDIHGSAYYCKKMIEAFKKENADKILHLGNTQTVFFGDTQDYLKSDAGKIFANVKEEENA